LQTKATPPPSDPTSDVGEVYAFHKTICYNKNMPLRKVPFINEEFYHVYNRGVNRRKIFLKERDYTKFIQTAEYYSFINHRIKFSEYLSLTPQAQADYFNKLSQKAIEIISFVLMPNHFHFLIKQTDEKGITNFMRIFENSYTKYFNLKHGRVGHLFQGQFKAVRIETNEQLLHISRYIHLNPLTSLVVKSTSELEEYPWSSYPSYLTSNNSNSRLLNIQPILDQFESNKKYQEFVSDQSTYQQELELIKHLALED